MHRHCPKCGDEHGFNLVAPGDVERSFDFETEWRGLRLLCPACGNLERISFRPMALTNQRVPGVPDTFRVHAMVAPGPEVICFPGRPAQPEPPR